jgi:predicted component of type VI protein secretion system
MTTAAGRAVKTLVIGRSPSADVAIADGSLAPHHAELVLTDDGRFHLTDCATDGGTWRRPEADDAAAWEPVRQAFVQPDEPLRLGDHRCTARELAARSRSGSARGPAGGGAWDGGAPHRVQGPVARDPATGEIVRRRP